MEFVYNLEKIPVMKSKQFLRCQNAILTDASLACFSYMLL